VLSTSAQSKRVPHLRWGNEGSNPSRATSRIGSGNPPCAHVRGRGGSTPHNHLISTPRNVFDRRDPGRVHLDSATRTIGRAFGRGGGGAVCSDKRHSVSPGEHRDVPAFEKPFTITPFRP